jgi:hypothetical protein
MRHAWDRRRRALMREGVTPAASQPRLMRGETL